VSVFIQSKYVVLRQHDSRFGESENIYVFPDNVIHADIVRDMRPNGCECIGAGFVVRGLDGEHYCNGRSDSLELESRPEDTVLLKLLLGENH
jgi:hypothetical protein